VLVGVVLGFRLALGGPPFDCFVSSVTQVRSAGLNPLAPQIAHISFIRSQAPAETGLWYLLLLGNTLLAAETVAHCQSNKRRSDLVSTHRISSDTIGRCCSTTLDYCARKAEERKAGGWTGGEHGFVTRTQRHMRL
jgi:hypothetical protein